MGVCPSRKRPPAPEASASAPQAPDPVPVEEPHSYKQSLLQNEENSSGIEDHDEAASRGREALRAYIDSTLARVRKTAPPLDTLQSKIEPSVAASIGRLSAGAPPVVRTALHKALVDHKVLPNSSADQAQFEAALAACLQALGLHGPPPAPPPQRRPGPEPTQQDLKDLAGVIARLWAIDEPHRLQPGQDYALCHQARAPSMQHLAGGSESCEDAAAMPLFERVDGKKLLADPLTRAFIALLDNYEADTTKAETYSKQEQQEMDIFMQVLLRKPHMQFIHKVLVAWGKVGPDPAEFASRIYEIWFTQYGKGRGPKTSSGFEHVFVGEQDVQDNEIKGLHNWIQFWREERAGRLNYKGYVGALTEEDERLIKVRFSWNEDDKAVSTLLVGTSVAFQFAWASCAFLSAEKGECCESGIMFGDVGPVTVKTFSWDIWGHGHNEGSTVLSSAFLDA